MQQLRKGDLCKVRLHTGKVDNAFFDCESEWDKCYWVYLSSGEHALACDKAEPETEDIYQRVRFVGNPCILEWV